MPGGPTRSGTNRRLSYHSLFCLPVGGETSPSHQGGARQIGDVDVDPNLREIRITFDQAMSTGGHSIVGGGESFPELPGETAWKMAWFAYRLLRVRLQPNHSYWLSVNSQKFQNFRNRQGEPAVPYPIQFVTGAATSTTEMPQEKNTAAENQAVNAAAIDQLKAGPGDPVFLPRSPGNRLV